MGWIRTVTFNFDGVINSRLDGDGDFNRRLLRSVLLPDVDVEIVHAPAAKTCQSVSSGDEQCVCSEPLISQCKT